MKYSIILVLTFLFIGLQAQTFIKGTIKDSLSGEPAMYCNVLVKNSSDSVIAGTLSDFKGDFKLKVMGKEEAVVEISSLGYKTLTFHVALTDDFKTIKLGEIPIPKDDILLGETEIVASTQYMVQKFDRKIFNVNENTKAASNTILDLLKTLPGVVVDAEGNVQYKGASATIYVDDMPAEYMYPNIEMIPIDKVAKIELIDASMRTGGSGKGGIINIRMKGATSDGLSGVISSRFATDRFKQVNRYNGFFNLNYKSDKLLFFNNLYRNTSYDYELSRFTGIVEYGENTYGFYEDYYQEFNNYGLMDHIGAIYTPGMNTKITIATGFNRWNNTSSNSLIHFQKDTQLNTITDEYYYDKNNSTISFFSGAYVHLHHTFDTLQKELSTYMYLLPREIDNGYTYNSDYYYMKQNSMDIDKHVVNYENAVHRRHAIISGLYYNHPINEKTRWNLDYSGNYTWVLKQDLNYLVNGNPNYSLMMDNNGFMQNDKLSLRLGTMLKNWKLDGGITAKYDYYNINALRYKNSSVESDTNMLVKKSYVSFLPSATIGYVLNKLSEFKLTYALTVMHPEFSQVIDYVNKGNPLHWLAGNPGLEPVHYHNVYLGYSYNKQVWNASLDVFYSLTNNDISNLRYPVSEIQFLSTPMNVASKQNIGVDVSTFVSIKRFININLSGSIFHSEFDITQIEQNLIDLGYETPDIETQNYGYNAKLYANILLGKKSSIMIWMMYKSKEITFNGYNNRQIGAYTSVTRRFLKDNGLILNFGVNNFLGKLKQFGDYQNMSGFEQTQDRLDATYMRPIVFASLKYNFRQGDRNTGDIKAGN